MTKNKLYALDFDGVICDSAVETGMAGWQVARQLWPEMPSQLPPELLDAFRQVRPVMETGYEAILIMRCLYQQVSTEILLNDFQTQMQQIITNNVLSTDDLKQRFGQYRDQWIAEDVDNWIAMNPLFANVKNKLAALDKACTYIITTKQERFVTQILTANDIVFPAEHIYGLDRKLSKPQILADLSTEQQDASILFVEDRLPTLLDVIKDQRLENVELYFADWGYNTETDKQAAQSHHRIHTLSLIDIATL